LNRAVEAHQFDRGAINAAQAKHLGHMTGDNTVVLGIEIPSTDPVFVGIIVGIHIPLGLACVAAGAVGMLSAKGRGRHSTAGKVYYWCLLSLFASATFLSIMRWAENYHLFTLGALSFASAWLARRALGSVGPTGLGCTSRGWASLMF
jgi:hypothetical protein